MNYNRIELISQNRDVDIIIIPLDCNFEYKGIIPTNKSYQIFGSYQSKNGLKLYHVKQVSNGRYKGLQNTGITHYPNYGLRETDDQKFVYIISNQDKTFNLTDYDIFDEKDNYHLQKGDQFDIKLFKLATTLIIEDEDEDTINDIVFDWHTCHNNDDIYILSNDELTRYQSKTKQYVPKEEFSNNLILFLR